MNVHKALYVARVLALSFLAALPAFGEDRVYLSLYYADPATTKTIHDMLLLVDGRSLSIERGKIRPPKTVIRTKWSEFDDATLQPPASDLGLRFKVLDGKTNVCLHESCAVVAIACPRRQVVTRVGAKCFAEPSLVDLEKVK